MDPSSTLGWNTTDPEPVGRAVVSLLSGLVAGYHRRTHPRRRRLPRDGGPDKVAISNRPSINMDSTSEFEEAAG